ncbi:hypothetical protein [uncultured Arcticibacterium sp.]|uniref:hypothetical protein n=1 Tax=uncultured Arcticibacterium sp. TaxID=2173042 RepID=UPI0030F9FFB6
MREFLKKIKLLDYLDTELEIGKKDFVIRLSRIVDIGRIDIISDSFDVFISSKNKYKGEVSSDGFRIKRRKRLFEMNNGLAVATGSFTQYESKLMVHTEINGFHKIMILFLGVVFLFYALFFIDFFVSGDIRNDFQGYILPLMFIHAVFMLGVPYFLIRRSVMKLKHELEREFFYLTK